jgi:hypothetical protein
MKIRLVKVGQGRSQDVEWDSDPVGTETGLESHPTGSRANIQSNPFNGKGRTWIAMSNIISITRRNERSGSSMRRSASARRGKALEHPPGLVGCHGRRAHPGSGPDLDVPAALTRAPDPCLVAMRGKGVSSFCQWKSQEMN